MSLHVSARCVCVVLQCSPTSGICVCYNMITNMYVPSVVDTVWCQ